MCENISNSRRRFVVGASCLAASLYFPNPLQSQEAQNFFCSTIIPPLDGDIDLQDNTGGDNPIDLGGTGDTPNELTLQGAARSRLRWRPSDGLPAPNGVIRLGVGFVGNPSSAWREEVQRRALLWTPSNSPISRRIVFDFSVPLDQCHIRIRQTGVGTYKPANRSFVGRDARNRRLGDGQSTMYIYNLSSVEHEFGHALCLTHEHFNEALPVTIDIDKAEEYYSPLGWSRQDVINNLFAPAERCIGDPGWNATSVMGYNVPKEITVEGISLVKTGNINSRDRRCLDALYQV